MPTVLTWWRHQMEYNFRVTGALCGELTGHWWIPLTKGQWRGALMFSLICALNIRLSKHLWGWWFETTSRSLWRHCNDRGQFWPSGIEVACVCLCVCVRVCQLRVCPRDYSSPVPARATKFVQKTQNTVTIVIAGCCLPHQSKCSAIRVKKTIFDGLQFYQRSACLCLCSSKLGITF